MQVSCLGAVIGICTWGGERISPLNSIVLLLLLESMLSIIDIILSSHCLFLSFVWVHKRICCLVICISLPIFANLRLQPTCVNHSLMTQISPMTMSTMTWGVPFADTRICCEQGHNNLAGEDAQLLRQSCPLTSTKTWPTCGVVGVGVGKLLDRLHVKAPVR
jgi:hypothetical protein